jgi:hypothetical protein
MPYLHGAATSESALTRYERMKSITVLHTIKLEFKSFMYNN